MSHVVSRFMSILACTATAAIAVITLAPSPASAAMLISLGDLPGGGGSHSNSVSGDGSVVVGVSGGYGGQAFRWTAAGGMVGLGRPPGDFYSYARAANGDGSVVVGGSDYAESVDEYTEYYRTQAFRWTAAGGMQGLGHLPGGGLQSVAVGVSADGSAIIGSSDSALGYEAFRWTSAGGMVGLGFLPGDLDSQAYGISADGSIVVGTSSSAGSVRVFRWTSADGMVGLGSLPGGFNPVGFSADGSVVVGYETQGVGPSYTALYWTPDGGTRTLWDVLLSQGVDPAADGWSRLELAKATSADGNTIVGDGIRNGNHEAFVAVIPSVPEPATGALALLGMSSILLLRRRSLRRPKGKKGVRTI